MANDKVKHPKIHIGETGGVRVDADEFFVQPTRKHKKMKITSEMTEAAYLASKEVYEGIRSKQDAIDHLVNDLKMNGVSASNYINNFKKMMDGEGYKRSHNKYATDYHLTKILEDYGVDGLASAIQAVKEHIKYCESSGNTSMGSTRRVMSHHEKILKGLSVITYPDEIDEKDTNTPFYEGAKKSVTVNVYERDPKARDECIEHHGCFCMVCGFNFEKVYGDIGKGFIHVHHLVPLADINKEYVVNPIEDLVPVCPNCHAMLHRRKPPYTPDELKEMGRV